MNVSLPITQRPLGFFRMVGAIFCALWLFMLSLWLVTALFFGAAMRGFGV
jgi:hypothetical protein